MELKKGQTIMVDANLQQPSSALHEDVSERSGLPADTFELYHGSKRLEGQAVLGSWGVEKDSLIEVKTRGRGGMRGGGGGGSGADGGCGVEGGGGGADICVGGACGVDGVGGVSSGSSSSVGGGVGGGGTGGIGSGSGFGAAGSGLRVAGVDVGGGVDAEGGGARKRPQNPEGKPLSPSKVHTDKQWLQNAEEAAWLESEADHSDSMLSIGPYPLWTVISREFREFHQHPLNIAFHLVTTPAAIFALAALLAHFSGNLTLMILTGAWAISLAPSVPVRLWLVTCVTLYCLSQAAAVFAGTGQLTGMAAILVVSYVSQDLAHWMTGEPTFQASYAGRQEGWIWTFIAHTHHIVPLCLDACWHTSLAALFVQRRQVVKGNLHGHPDVRRFEPRLTIYLIVAILNPTDRAFAVDEVPAHRRELGHWARNIARQDNTLVVVRSLSRSRQCLPPGGCLAGCDKPL